MQSVSFYSLISSFLKQLKSENLDFIVVLAFAQFLGSEMLNIATLGCFNIPVDPFPEDIKNELKKKYEGGIAVCDDGGVTVIPQDLLNENMLNRLHRIEMQEDIWFFCLDTLKWDTKKIVCDKDYLTEQGLLSSIHIEQLKEFGKYAKGFHLVFAFPGILSDKDNALIQISGIEI